MATPRKSENEKVAADVEAATAPDATSEEVASEEVASAAAEAAEVSGDAREITGASKLSLLQAKASGAALPVDSNPITEEPADLPDPKGAKVVEAAGTAKGTVKAQVVFARFNWYDGARIRYANRGEVVKLSAKIADAGEKLGALRRV